MSLIRIVARVYNTSLRDIMDMDWLDVVEHAFAANEDDMAEKMFAAKVAGAKMKRKVT